MVVHTTRWVTDNGNTTPRRQVAAASPSIVRGFVSAFFVVRVAVSSPAGVSLIQRVSARPPPVYHPSTFTQIALVLFCRWAERSSRRLPKFPASPVSSSECNMCGGRCGMCSSATDNNNRVGGPSNNCTQALYYIGNCPKRATRSQPQLYRSVGGLYCPWLHVCQSGLSQFVVTLIFGSFRWELDHFWSVRRYFIEITDVAKIDTRTGELSTMRLLLFDEYRPTGCAN